MTWSLYCWPRYASCMLRANFVDQSAPHSPMGNILYSSATTPTSCTRASLRSGSVSKMEQQNALHHYTMEQKWETVNSDRARSKGSSRRGTTGGIRERLERVQFLGILEGRDDGLELVIYLLMTLPIEDSSTLR